MRPRILVIGATGTIGSHLCNRLHADRADFKALVRNAGKAGPMNEKGIKTVAGDLDAKESLLEAMDGIDKLFLLSVTSPDIPRLQGNAVDAALKKGVRHIVKISARGADSAAHFNIARFHGQAEKIIRESGIPFTFLRPHSFMQNLFFDAKTIREQNAIYSSLGTGRIPMVDARDIAEVAFTALTQEGHEDKSYYLTGPQAISYEDIAEKLSIGLDRKIKVLPITLQEEYNQSVKAGLPIWLAEDMKIVNGDYSEGKGSDLSPDVEKVTGRKAIDIGQFIADHIGRFK
jgi:uncharacterized protein YbjT (DUF2867 family)